MVRKKFNLFKGTIVLIFLLIPIPIFLSSLIEFISKIWNYFPKFSKPEFFEEYYKLLGTFAVMIVGFWFADSLIQNRSKLMSQKRTRNLTDQLIQLRSKMENLKGAIKEKNTNNIKECNTILTDSFNKIFNTFGNTQVLDHVLNLEINVLLGELNNYKSELERALDDNSKITLISRIQDSLKKRIEEVEKCHDQ